ncbi:MAG: glycosyltransferase family 2 protein [Thermodesulfobacteriota bacterium]
MIAKLPDLTVIILTYNEEIHIERCLRSAAEIACRIIVVDSYSTDRTITIAQSIGAEVWQHQFTNHAAQLAWALENLPIQTEWVMRVDADEIITPKLAESLRCGLLHAAPEVNGFLVCRYVRFMGRMIRHGNFPQWHLRVWRHGQAYIEQRWMDEHMVLKSGRAERLDGEFIDDNLNSITWWTNKHNAYASREAIDLLNRKYRFLKNPPTVSDGLNRQARYKRWLKENLYAHLPIGLRALVYFSYRMIFQLGLLDGRAGFVFHFLQGCWYRYLVDVKVWEVERKMRDDGIGCVDAIRSALGVELAYEVDATHNPSR